MADQPSRTYSDLIALLVAAVIMLIMISITEAAASHERVAGSLDASVYFPQTERIGSPIRREVISLRWQ